MSDKDDQLHVDNYGIEKNRFSDVRQLFVIWDFYPEFFTFELQHIVAEECNFAGVRGCAAADTFNAIIRICETHTEWPLSKNFRNF